MLTRILIIVLALAGISGYAFFESRNLIRGPVIVVEEPNSGTLMRSATAQIKGWTKNISNISLNDRNITVNEQGQFDEKVALAQGLNVIKISAKDKFGRSKDVFVELIHKEGEELVVR